MTLTELKKVNFQRLCREYGISEKDAVKLGALLDTSKQHGSQLLKGKSGIGEETIKKLCAAWGIDESEFVKPIGESPPEPDHPPPITRDDLLIRYIDQLAARINAQSKVIESLAQRLAENSNRDQAQGNRLEEISKHLTRIDDCLMEAAMSGDVKRLKRSGGTG